MDPTEPAESAFVALSRQLANATMVRGPGFTVVESIDADAMVTLHIASCQQVLLYLDERENKTHVCVFFKALSNLLSTVTPVDAMKM